MPVGDSTVWHEIRNFVSGTPCDAETGIEVIAPETPARTGKRCSAGDGGAVFVKIFFAVAHSVSYCADMVSAYQSIQVNPGTTGA